MPWLRILNSPVSSRHLNAMVTKPSLWIQLETLQITRDNNYGEGACVINFHHDNNVNGNDDDDDDNNDDNENDENGDINNYNDDNN